MEIASKTTSKIDDAILTSTLLTNRFTSSKAMKSMLIATLRILRLRSLLRVFLAASLAWRPTSGFWEGKEATFSRPVTTSNPLRLRRTSSQCTMRATIDRSKEKMCSVRYMCFVTPK